MSNPDSANWIYAMDDAALLEGHMAAAYPLGVNVLIARVGGKIYAVSGRCLHMACPLFTGSWRATQLPAHVTTGGSMFAQAGFSTRPNSDSRSILQSRRPASCSSISIERGFL